jgi:hypothetical protein
MGLFAEIPQKIMEIINGKKEGASPKYSYDPNSQQYTAMKKGGKVSSASARADGCAVKGKTKGRMI